MKTTTTMQADAQGPVVLHFDEAVYMVCDEMTYDVDGTPTGTRCGALIDVTGQPVFRREMPVACHCQHVSTYNDRTA